MQSDKFLALGIWIFAVMPGIARAETATYPVGVRQLEWVEPKDGRVMSMVMFYPAVVDASAKVFNIAMAANLRLYGDCDVAFDGKKHPLIMFSHGRGGSAWDYAWFAQRMAANGYVVAALNHYHANSYDRDITYLANKIWQRPVDVSLDVTFLLKDPFWGRLIDPSKIGMAGHSQGGFTSLWIGGARVNKERFLAFQQLFINNPQIPDHIRSKLPLDAGPALDVEDDRIGAVFAMAPGIIQAFGMDEAGLSQLDVPAYLVAGADDKAVPPGENAEFAAKYVPGAKLSIIPGPVGHEIFTNECTDEGRDELPEACIDAPGVNRAELHQEIGEAALKFFADALHVQ